MHHHHFHHGEKEYKEEWKGRFQKRVDPEKRYPGYVGVNPADYLNED